MPSPFPGMDPYLEDSAFRPDFHHTFISCWREAIAEGLPASYEARIDERVNLVKMEPGVVKLIYPDVAISQSTQPGPASIGVALLEPETIEQQFVEESRESYIEILHRPERTLVAVLELFSPTNKSGDGFLQYQTKRRLILQQNVHLFELDLLLGGQPLTLARELPHGDYRAFLTRAETRAACQVYTWSIRQTLPTLPVPLRAPDADVRVDLQSVFELAYERGRYARALPYRQPPASVASQEDKSWALNCVAQKTNGAL